MLALVLFAFLFQSTGTIELPNIANSISLNFKAQSLQSWGTPIFTNITETISTLEFLNKPAPSEPQKKISNQSIYQYSPIVRLLIKKTGHEICGGSFIGNNSVISAAHCLYGEGGNLLSPSDLEVSFYPEKFYKIGDGNPLKISVDRFEIYPQYDFNTKLHDIAILVIPPIYFKIRPLRVANKGLIPSGISTFKGYRTHGGRKFLLEVPVQIVPNSNCTILLRKNGVDRVIHPNQICGSGPTNWISPGDSGTGLLCKNKNGIYNLCGIVSFGFQIITLNGPPLPNVLTNVGMYSDFIQDAAKNKTNWGSFSNTGIAIKIPVPVIDFMCVILLVQVKNINLP